VQSVCSEINTTQLFLQLIVILIKKTLKGVDIQWKTSGGFFIREDSCPFE